MDAWQVYMEEFRTRTERAQQQRFGRQSMFTEAAHDAYQAATDRLTREHGWDEERALVIMRGLNAGVQQWLQLGAVELDALAAELQRREERLADGYSPEGGAGFLR